MAVPRRIWGSALRHKLKRFLPRLNGAGEPLLAAPHPRQAERVAALYASNLLDTPREAAFDDIAELAKQICDTPIALVTLVDKDRQWFKAECGLDGLEETDLQSSVCSHTILGDGLTVIPDMRKDPRTRNNPLCADAPYLRFYAGATLYNKDRLPLGAICVLDYRPRRLSPGQQRSLKALARQASAQIELRQEASRNQLLVDEVEHRVKNSLAIVSSVLRMQISGARSDETREALQTAKDRIAAIGAIHDQLHLSPDIDVVDLSAFVGQIVNALQAQGPEDITWRVEAPSAPIAARDAINVGLLINELATNAMKHGFPEGGPGEIRVEAREVENGLVTIKVSDDGLGLPEDFEPDKVVGLGMRLSQAMSRQYGDALRWERLSPRGSCFTFSAPSARRD